MLQWIHLQSAVLRGNLFSFSFLSLPSREISGDWFCRRSGRNHFFRHKNRIECSWSASLPKWFKQKRAELPMTTTALWVFDKQKPQLKFNFPESINVVMPPIPIDYLPKIVDIRMKRWRNQSIVMRAARHFFLLVILSSWANSLAWTELWRCCYDNVSIHTVLCFAVNR